MEEERLIELLTAFVAENKAPFLGRVFDSILQDETEIRKVWSEFFTIASNDAGNHANICKDLSLYVKDDKLDFTDNHTITVADYECYLKSVLRTIDPVIYNDHYFKVLKNGKERMAGSFIRELNKRVAYYRKGKLSSDDFSGAFGLLGSAKDKRNNEGGSHTANVRYGDTMQAFTLAFFAATVVGRLVQNLGAGFKVGGVSGARVVVLSENGTEFFRSSDYIMPSAIKSVVLSRDSFGDGQSMNVIIKVSAPDYVTQQQPLSVSRGKFLERPSKNFKLSKQGAEKKTETRKTEPRETTPETEEPKRTTFHEPSREPSRLHHVVEGSLKWVAAAIVVVFALLIWDVVKQMSKPDETEYQEVVMKVSESDIPGYYTYAETSANGTIENIQSAMVLPDGSSYRLHVLADGGEMIHLFRKVSGSDSLLESETLGEGEICSEKGKIVITFNNEKLCIIQKTSAL